jgi:hypothetical protein
MESYLPFLSEALKKLNVWEKRSFARKDEALVKTLERHL